MKKNQTEYNKAYLMQYTRPQIAILKSEYEIYKGMIKNKGYKSINDYVNTVLAYDIKNNVIPDKKDIIPDSEIKEE